ncbi:DUF6538 domain-containing protein [Stenotrophomonas maltophilia]|uniref:DUF6538 domain-containing protein n=1 Tax=Stenotrophomonas maltophilia TaxID=40324 RepID=UPI001F52CD63|nr:DUF6538 domain-containing protein [Stenotrophomonas maltophilia]MCI1057401.1 hypothetical protein [Stenotrophomonas maltophilia]MCI1061303.1 hypothetical protein [Stenotrophomonas maltophilia]MCI1077878.1 hypothetical protein [Stenotrophomonas maltophilia]MCI1082259.1 hypothetical protein [Stenotrophomonas maltophilia]MCI1094731.1 hypothetical protein [Stenotrophomonas maltophilia]
MKTCSYLVRGRNGYAFRLRLPNDLAPFFPKKSIKNALGSDLRRAQLAALLLADRYAVAFEELRRALRMASNKGQFPSLDEIIELQRQALEEVRAEVLLDRIDGFKPSNAKNINELKMGVGPDGPYFQTDPGDSPEVIAMAMKKLEGMMDSYVPKPSDENSPAKIVGIAATKAADEYLNHIKPTTKPKTLTIKATAINDFVSHYTSTAKAKKKAILADVRSGDVGAWISKLHQTLAQNTVHNKAVYVQGFFKWAINNNFYANGNNPAAGHTSFPKKKQQERLKFGFRAFTSTEIQHLFDPQNFSRIGPDARWGVLLSLYTGARASEIGQLRLEDFGRYEKGMLPEQGLLPLLSEPSEKLPWTYAVCFTDEAPGQSLKSADSKRIIFLHDDLIELGLIERWKALHDEKQDQFFPSVNFRTQNGAGNWLSKAFTLYKSKLILKDAKSSRKVGLHSFRKTTTQKLQSLSGGDQLRLYYLGHELDSVQGVVYAHFSPLVQREHYEKKSYGIAINAIRSMMNEKRQRKGRGI